MHCVRTGALLLALALLATPAPARASAELRKELAGLAKDLKKVLDARGLESLGLGQFTGPPNFATSAGPGVSQILTEELAKLGVTVKRRAKLGLKGEYFVTEVPDEDDKGTKLLAVRLVASLVDDRDKVITGLSFERKVKGEQAVLQFIGASVELPPDETPKERDRKIRDGFGEPEVHTTGTVVRAGKGSKFGIELLVGRKPRAPVEGKRPAEGLAFVPVEREEIYTIRLVNDSDHEVAVRLMIDGLSLFAFSDLRHEGGKLKGEPLYSMVLVPAHESVTIKGWHRTNDKAYSFLVTEYAKTAAAHLKQTAKVGTITATFAAAWLPDGLPPKDEPGKPKNLSPGDGTGLGPPVEVRLKAVKRKVGVVRAAVSVRYTKPENTKPKNNKRKNNKPKKKERSG
jgi:hypothetical protein